MIDAGSSGSRAYLYAWPSHSGDMRDLLKIRPLLTKRANNQQNEEPLVEKVTPGLSRYLPSFVWVYNISLLLLS